MTTPLFRFYYIVSKGGGILKVTLRELRKEYNITQTELSIKTNISRQTINMLENNSYIPSLKTAKRLAMFFNTSIECIFIFEEEDL